MFGAVATLEFTSLQGAPVTGFLKVIGVRDGEGQMWANLEDKGGWVQLGVELGLLRLGVA